MLRARERLAKIGFPPDDELLPLVSGAENALQRLWVFPALPGVQWRERSEAGAGVSVRLKRKSSVLS
jgi:hypothetical protein